MTHLRSAPLAAGLLAAALAFAAPAGADGARGTAYVSNQDGDISVIDIASLAVVGTIDAEDKAPRGIGITGDGKLLVTANRDGGDISVIERASGKVIRHIKIGKNPEFVRILGDRAFISFEPSAKGGAKPQEKDDDGDREPAKIAVVDLKQMRLIRQITSGPETEGIEFAPDGKRMLVTNEADNTVTLHDIASGKLLKTVSTEKYGNRPRGIKVSPDGKHYVVTLEYGDNFLVLDDKLNPVKAVPTGKTPYGVSFDREGRRLFVASAKEKKLQVFDGTSFEKIAEMPTGDRCWHFSFTPDDAQILLACGRSNDIHVFDAQTYAPVKQIGGKNLPWGVVTWPKSMGSLDRP
jgi:DNA-binding beta-propeller fold protein YncE